MREAIYCTGNALWIGARMTTLAESVTLKRVSELLACEFSVCVQDGGQLTMKKFTRAAVLTEACV